MNNFEENHSVFGNSKIGYRFDENSKTIHIKTKKGNIMYFLTRNKWQLGNKNYKGTASEFLSWYKKNFEK